MSSIPLGIIAPPRPACSLPLAVLALLLSCAIPRAQAQQAPPLVPVVSGSDGSSVSIDPGSVTRSGDSSFVLTTVVRFSAAVGEQHKADREVDTDELDCAQQRSRGIAWALYRADTLVSADNVSDGWKPVEADWAPMAQAMCAMLLHAFAATLPVEHELASVDSVPRLLNPDEVQAWALTQYPMRDRRSDRLVWAGGTTLRFRVESSGAVDSASVRVLWSSRPQFTEAAFGLLRRMRFAPALLQGDPVAVWVTYPLTFDLNCDQSLGVRPVERSLPPSTRRPRACNR